MLNARIPSRLVFGYVCVYTAVKKPNAWGQPAGVRGINTLEASQRLNAKNLTHAYLVGLFEGDGFFTVSKKGEYMQCEIGIELSLRDVQLIYKIKEILGVGVVGFIEKNAISMVYFIIRKKSHLIDFVLPILDKYPLFSNKQYDYLRLRNVLLSNLVLYADIPQYTRPSESLNTIESILNAPYFSGWLVGFIED